jgi:hypothetical protein
MSIDDPWAATPTTIGPAAPPRPDTLGAVAAAPLAPSYAAGDYARAQSWKRAGAILGVVWAFFFLLTIPGWLALAHYKKWKRNEITTPYGLIWWGYGFSALVVIAVLSSAGS